MVRSTPNIGFQADMSHHLFMYHLGYNATWAQEYFPRLPDLNDREAIRSCIETVTEMHFDRFGRWTCHVARRRSVFRFGFTWQGLVDIGSSHRSKNGVWPSHMMPVIGYGRWKMEIWPKAHEAYRWMLLFQMRHEQSSKPGMISSQRSLCCGMRMDGSNVDMDVWRWFKIRKLKIRKAELTCSNLLHFQLWNLQNFKL